MFNNNCGIGADMLINVWKNKIKIMGFKKEGRKKLAILENGSCVPSGELREIEIQCYLCHKKTEIKWRAALLKKSYICMSCLRVGEKNPFYGKTHPIERRKRHSERMKGKHIGKNNPFYGRRHSKETKRKISDTVKACHLDNDNPFYGRRHTPETIAKITNKNKEYQLNLTNADKERISQKLKKSAKEFRIKNPKYYSEIKKRAAKESARSQSKYKINNLEKYFFDAVRKEGIVLEYNIMLNFMQFDFGHKESKTLIEIHGDYWHGNSKKYAKLNEVQKRKKERDKEKKDWAIKNGFKYLVFWEDDVYNQTRKVIQEVKNAIKV